MYKYLAIIFLLFLSYTFSCKRIDSKQYLSVKLYDWDGGMHSLNDYSGKIVVLEFWATWCEPCKQAAPIIDRLRKKSNKKTTIFWGVNTDQGKTLEELKLAAKNFGMKYNSLLDPNMELSDALKIEGLPALIILDPDGRVYHKQYGVGEWQYLSLLKKLKELEE